MLKITKLLLVFLLGFIILLVSVLFSGIKINSFSFGNINVSQFYIKLDKKLIVDIDYIEYKSKKSQVKNSYDDLKKNIELLPKVLKIFKKIHVERLKIDGNEFTISLNSEELYLDNKFINISSKLQFLSNQVIFDMYSLYLKDVKLMLDGKIKVDYFNEKLDHFGKYYYKDIEGDVKLEFTEDLASFYLNSNSFKSLKFLKDFFRLSSEAESWMYDNVKGDIKLDEFYGKFDIKNKKILEESLYGRAHIDKAKIRFDKKLKTVDTKRTNVVFKDDKLSFELIEPKFDSISIKGSNVVINNLTSEEKGEVVVNIYANTRLDKRILNILKVYDVDLPLVQKSGITNAFVKLEIPYAINKPMKTTGKFKVSKANIHINDFAFYSRKADVILDGSIVKVKNTDFKYKDMIRANVNLDINTKTLKSKGNASIKSFLIKTDSDKIIRVKNKKTPITLDFNDGVKVGLSALNTKVRVDDLIYVDISKLKSIYKYSPLLQDIPIKDGNISLVVKDENDLTFNAYASGFDFPIEKNGKKITALNITGKIKGKTTTITSKNKDIKVIVKNDELYIDLKNLDIVLDTKNSNTDSTVPPLNIKARNVKLKLDDEVYNINWANARVKSNDISFSANVKNLDLPIKKQGKDVTNLTLEGTYKKGKTFIKTKDNSLVLNISNDNKMNIKLSGYDVHVDTENKDKEELNDISIKAKNSNIIINKKYKFLADNFEVRLRNDTTFFHLNHKKSDITYKKDKNNEIDIYANNISDTFVNTIFNKKILKGGKIMLLAHGMENDLKGKLLLTNVKIEDLAILNNLLLFIHSSPALINPLLAIPSVVGMASNGGFNLTGYQVIDGLMEFTHNKEKEYLDITKLVTIGNGIDFDAKGKINLKDLTLKSKIKLVFFKNYSSLVGVIPVVNYVLLGKNKRVDTEVNIFGDLNNPKISTNLTKDAFSVPVNIAKRILTSPVKLFEFISDSKKEKPKK